MLVRARGCLNWITGAEHLSKQCIAICCKYLVSLPWTNCFYYCCTFSWITATRLCKAFLVFGFVVQAVPQAVGQLHPGDVVYLNWEFTPDLFPPPVTLVDPIRYRYYTVIFLCVLVQRCQVTLFPANILVGDQVTNGTGL